MDDAKAASPAGSDRDSGPESDLALLEKLPSGQEIEVHFTTLSCFVPKLFGQPSGWASLRKLVPSKGKADAEAGTEGAMRQVRGGLWLDDLTSEAGMTNRLPGQQSAPAVIPD